MIPIIVGTPGTDSKGLEKGLVELEIKGRIETVHATVLLKPVKIVRKDLGSISDRVIPKTKKMVLDAALLNSQHYKVRIKGKVEQSRERSSALSYTSV